MSLSGPSPNDPLKRNDFAETNDQFLVAIRNIVQQELTRKLRGLTSDRLDGVPNEILAMELIARGWIAYKPSQPK